MRGVDASLIEEWELLRDPNYVPTPIQVASRPEDEPAQPTGITADTRTFTVLVRNAVFGVVRALAQRQYELAVSLLEPASATETEHSTPQHTAASLEETMVAFYADHELIRTDPRARGTALIAIDTTSERQWAVTQKLTDPAEHDDWLLELRVDLARSNEEDRPVLLLDRIAGS